MDSRSYKMKDNINPSHYQQGDIEVIDFILDQNMSYIEGNIIKYVCRYKFKNGLEDLNKAKWYLESLITSQEQQQWMHESTMTTLTSEERKASE